MLWIASSGGHIAEAALVDQVVRSSDQSLWVTFDTPQTRSLLSGRRVEYVDYVAPRDGGASARAARAIARLCRQERFDACITTGSAIAGLSVPLIRGLGVPSFYVESLARVVGPSLTGQLMRLAPGVKTLSQYPGWGRSWSYEGSIVDGWRPVDTASDGVRRVLVTLGTIRPYRFDRAVDAVLASLRPGDEVVWQIGSTTRADLPGEVHVELSYAQLAAEMERADVVVAHAGVGSAIQALAQRKVPLLAVRSASHREHVDDHQRQFSAELFSRGLAVPLELGADNRNLFEWVAGRALTSTRESQEV